MTIFLAVRGLTAAERAKDPYLRADDERLDRSFGRASLRMTRAS
jgi:hypothetical protein